MSDMTTYDPESVTEHYLVALLWTGLYYAGEDEPPEQLDDYVTSIHDLPEGIWQEARGDVADFLAALDEDGLTEPAAERWDDEQLGHDLALTRNRHGAGFWDRGHGELGDRLTKHAHAMGESNLTGYGDNIYLEG